MPPLFLGASAPGPLARNSFTSIAPDAGLPLCLSPSVGLGAAPSTAIASASPPPRAPFLSALSASPIDASFILRSFAAISSALYLLGADETVADALCFAASSRGSSTSYASAAACFVGAYGVYPSLSIGRVRKSGGLSTRSNRSSADGRGRVTGLLFSGGGSGPNATGAAATIAAAASSESESESLESLRDGPFSSSLPYASSPKNAIVVTRLT